MSSHSTCFCLLGLISSPLHWRACWPAGRKHGEDRTQVFLQIDLQENLQKLYFVEIGKFSTKYGNLRTIRTQRFKSLHNYVYIIFGIIDKNFWICAFSLKLKWNWDILLSRNQFDSGSNNSARYSCSCFRGILGAV